MTYDERPVIGDYAVAYKTNKSGQIFRLRKGQWHEITGYMHRRRWIVKLRLKNGVFKTLSKHRVVYEAFKGQIPDGHIIVKKNGIHEDCRLLNLTCILESDYRKKIGHRARGRCVIQMDENELIVNSWPSATQASKALYMSKSSVLRMLNGEGENFLNIAWERETDLKLTDKRVNYGKGKTG